MSPSSTTTQPSSDGRLRNLWLDRPERCRSATASLPVLASNAGDDTTYRVFRSSGSDNDFAFRDARRHGDGVAILRPHVARFPYRLARFHVERDQAPVQRMGAITVFS